VRCGTPGYVAPEVINVKDTKRKYTALCDIFSLGLTFHILIFGISLFRKKTYNEIVAENRACKYDFSE
jgi:calcium-dependent protein kinase